MFSLINDNNDYIISKIHIYDKKLYFPVEIFDIN